MFLNRLKSFSPDRDSQEDLIELAAFVDLFRAKAKELGVETPDWFDTQEKLLLRAIKVTYLDEIEAKLSEMRSRRSALRTPDEKRADLEKQIEQLTQRRSVLVGS